MNIVRELRRKKGIQQKELAIAIGVSRPTVSEWEANKKDPSGERLQKLAKFFDVDELVILGKNVVDYNENPELFVPDPPEDSGISETDQIINRLLARLDSQPKTPEARILSKGVDKLPKEQRELALNVVKALFMQYEDYFKEDEQ